MRLIIALFKRKTENLCKRAQCKLACNCTASVAKFQFHKVVLKVKTESGKRKLNSGSIFKILRPYHHFISLPSLHRLYHR